MVTGQGAIALSGVARRFRIDGEQSVAALDGVSLDIGEGSAVALSGPSGSGKSTLLHIVGALERADEGTVTVGGRELAGMSRRELAAHRRRVGFVFQHFNLLPALTVIDNVMAPVLPYRVAFDKKARARASCSPRSGWRGARRRCRRGCRAASSSALPSRARSSTTQRSCWPTSRPATWTRAPAARSSACCSGCAPSAV
jgi:ABC-type uncharacterized transport system YnjBCD ATPase subunit